MTCWYCYWGVAKPVADIYQWAVDNAGWQVIEYGPGHIVWSDHNLEDGHIDACIADAEDRIFRKRYSAEELGVAVEALKRLRKVPENVRCCEPAEYKGENPELFPPPAGLVMVKL